MKILHLPLKVKWYNMIESDIKTEEYREIKPYWIKRLLNVINLHHTHYETIDNDCAVFYCSNVDLLIKDFNEGGFQPKDYTHILFRYGYTKRDMLKEIEKLTIGYGKPEWGAPTDKPVFILKFK